MKKPVQHAPKRVDMKLIFPFSGICLGIFPGARKQKQIGAIAIVSQKPEDVKRWPSETVHCPGAVINNSSKLFFFLFVES